MTLYLISVGLAEQEDMSIKAYQKAQTCDELYLETYTSKGNTPEELATFLQTPLIPLSRKDIEEQGITLVKKARDKNIGILIYGHALGATTHYALIDDCITNNIPYEVIHGSSILTAVSVTGLSLYNFGKTTSIPFHNEHVEEPYNALKTNTSAGLHTLLLLDLKPPETYMNVHEALLYLLRVEQNRKEGILHEQTQAIICAALGTKEETIRVGTIQELLQETIDSYPQVLIIPGKLTFYEEDFLKHHKR